MALDPTTNIGKVRLRVADYSDLPFFSDVVYQSVLDDNDNNLSRTARAMAHMILGLLSLRTHRRLNQLEVWGQEAFIAYKQFLLLTVKDPAFMDFAPIAYSSTADFSPILDFQANWNKNYIHGTDSQQAAFRADLSPNDGSRDYVGGI